MVKGVLYSLSLFTLRHAPCSLLFKPFLPSVKCVALNLFLAGFVCVHN
jgi:hypothetical protein